MMTRSLRFVLACTLCVVPAARALPTGGGDTAYAAAPATHSPHIAYATSDRATMYEMVRARHASGAGWSTATVAAIPAFARKYGMKCSACHTAVPELNNYGRAFRDRGYRMDNGNDDLRMKDPSYWPVFAWLWKNYELDTHRVGGRKVQQRGQIADGAVVFGALGSISDRISFRFLPQVYEDGLSFSDPGWIGVGRLLGTDWLNVRVGSPEFDLPFSGGREFNMGNARFQTLWFYTVPGSVSQFRLFGGARGIEIMGHNRGSRTRYSVHTFNTPGAPAVHTAWAAPGVFGHVTHRFELGHSFLRDIEFGAFGAYATWPVGPDSTDRKASRRFGGEIDTWLFSDALPLHLTAIGVTGSDDKALIPGAVRNGSYNAGMLQATYVPRLPLVFFGRLQAIRTRDQAIDGRPDDFGDQNFYQAGVRQAMELNTRFGWFLELSWSRQDIKRATPAGESAGYDILWLATHLVF